MSRDRQPALQGGVRMRALVSNCRLAHEAELPAIFDELLEAKTPVTVGFLNQHGYNVARGSASSYRIFESLDVLFRDGIGISIACKVFGMDPKDNLNGTDVIPSLVSYASRTLGNDVQFFAYGTAQPWLERGARELFSGAGFETLDGFQPIQSYVGHFKARRRDGVPAVVVLGMGMPKQELVAEAMKAALNSPMVIVCGGAILDFKAERFSRAPKAFRVLRLEWLYRLALEPRRLFARYVVGIPVFLFSVLKDRVT